MYKIRSLGYNRVRNRETAVNLASHLRYSNDTTPQVIYRPEGRGPPRGSLPAKRYRDNLWGRHVK